MHTDLQFKGVLRNNEDASITFLPKNDREVKVKYFKENRGNESALVHVAKVIIIPDKSVRLIHSKITNGSINKLVQPPFTFDPISQIEEDIEMGDITFDQITKHFKIPVLNNTGQDIVFERGEVIGAIHKLEEVDDVMDVYAVHYRDNETCSTSGFKSKINIEHLKDQPKQKLLKKQFQEIESKRHPNVWNRNNFN